MQLGKLTPAVPLCKKKHIGYILVNCLHSQKANCPLRSLFELEGPDMLGPASPAGFTGPGLGPHPVLATVVPQLVLLQPTTG